MRCRICNYCETVPENLWFEKETSVKDVMFFFDEKDCICSDCLEGEEELEELEERE